MAGIRKFVCQSRKIWGHWCNWSKMADAWTSSAEIIKLWKEWWWVYCLNYYLVHQNAGCNEQARLNYIGFNSHYSPNLFLFLEPGVYNAATNIISFPTLPFFSSFFTSLFPLPWLPFSSFPFFPLHFPFPSSPLEFLPQQLDSISPGGKGG